MRGGVRVESRDIDFLQDSLEGNQRISGKDTNLELGGEDFVHGVRGGGHLDLVGQLDEEGGLENGALGIRGDVINCVAERVGSLIRERIRC